MEKDLRFSTLKALEGKGRVATLGELWPEVWREAYWKLELT